MALISCPECKATVSDQAANCPKCGYPFQSSPQQTSAIEANPPHLDRALVKSADSGSGKKIWIPIIILSMPVLLVAGIYAHNKAIGPVGWAMDNTTKVLQEKMKDPDSMVIRSSYVVQKSNGKGDTLIYICGIVDGRNGFGGYTGGTRFASKSESDESLNTFDTWSVQLEDPEETRTAEKLGTLSGFESVYWNDWCVDSEHPALVAHASD